MQSVYCRYTILSFSTSETIVILWRAASEAEVEVLKHPVWVFPFSFLTGSPLRELVIQTQTLAHLCPLCELDVWACAAKPQSVFSAAIRNGGTIYFYHLQPLSRCLITNKTSFKKMNTSHLGTLKWSSWAANCSLINIWNVKLDITPPDCVKTQTRLGLQQAACLSLPLSSCIRLCTFLFFNTPPPPSPPWFWFKMCKLPIIKCTRFLRPNFLSRKSFELEFKWIWPW